MYWHSYSICTITEMHGGDLKLVLWTSCPFYLHKTWTIQGLNFLAPQLQLSEAGYTPTSYNSRWDVVLMYTISGSHSQYISSHYTNCYCVLLIAVWALYVVFLARLSFLFLPIHCVYSQTSFKNHIVNLFFSYPQVASDYIYAKKFLHLNNSDLQWYFGR